MNDDQGWTAGKILVVAAICYTLFLAGFIFFAVAILDTFH